MKHLFSLLLVVSCAALARAQTPAPAKAPIVLKPGHMQPQRNPAANRPDVAPEFPGGQQGLNEFFQQQVKYPEAARVRQLNGNVVTTATIDTTGRLVNPKVTTSLSPECDAEALRVLATMPRWKPAARKGRPVPILVQVPVPFNTANVLESDRIGKRTKFE